MWKQRIFQWPQQAHDTSNGKIKAQQNTLSAGGSFEPTADDFDGAPGACLGRRTSAHAALRSTSQGAIASEAVAGVH